MTNKIRLPAPIGRTSARGSPANPSDCRKNPNIPTGLDIRLLSHWAFLVAWTLGFD